MWVRRTFLLCLSLLAVGGCVESMVPGPLDRVQPVSDHARAGNVYLLRGWIGIFSYGIDKLGSEIEESGVRATVYQDDQWRALADKIAAEYRAAPQREPLVLVGHSYGADDVLRISRELDAAGIPVDLVVTLDPVTPPQVPKNIRLCYNIFQSNGVMDTLPFLRGIPLNQETKGAGELVNVDIRKDRTDLLEPGTDHFNIEKKAKVHGEVIKQVLTFCPPRTDWTAAQAAHGPTATNSPERRPSYYSGPWQQAGAGATPETHP